MADVKTPELSLGEWHELLEPYGWADITTHAPAVRFRVPAPVLEWEIRVMLKPGREVSQPGDEWAERSHLLGQARKAVEAVKARGYWLTEDGPQIEFRGRYMYRMDPSGLPAWLAEAELRFTVRPGRR